MKTERTRALGLASGSAKFVVTLKMRGSERNFRKVEKLVMEVLRKEMEEMSWHYTGSGTVDVEWEISPNP